MENVKECSIKKSPVLPSKIIFINFLHIFFNFEYEIMYCVLCVYKANGKRKKKEKNNKNV